MTRESNKIEESGVERSRREFLKTAGKIAVYTPPAMLAMSSPSFASIAKSAGTDCQGGGKENLRKFHFSPFQNLRNSWWFHKSRF